MVDTFRLTDLQPFAANPAWLRSATVLERLDNYLRSGICFVYLQAALKPAAEPVAAS